MRACSKKKKRPTYHRQMSGLKRCAKSASRILKSCVLFNQPSIFRPHHWTKENVIISFTHTCCICSCLLSLCMELYMTQSQDRTIPAQSNETWGLTSLHLWSFLWFLLSVNSQKHCSSSHTFVLHVVNILGSTEQSNIKLDVFWFFKPHHPTDIFCA